MKSYIKEILFSEEDIKSAVERLGKKITADYEGKELVLVGVLKGSVIFFSDLVRSIDMPVIIDFIGASSYHDSTHSSGEVNIYKKLELDIKGKHVILVEDILDTAQTMYKLIKVLEKDEPASLKICTLLDKDGRRVVDVSADYKCFNVQNQFVVGYGLDFDEKYRNLPYIGIFNG